MKTIRVETQRPYSVKIGRGLLCAAGDHIAKVHPSCTATLVADQTVAGLFGGRRV
jgi:hypothetical protein